MKKPTNFPNYNKRVIAAVLMIHSAYALTGYNFF